MVFINVILIPDSHQAYLYMYHCSIIFKFYLYLFIALYRDKYRSFLYRRLSYSLLVSYGFIRYRIRQSFSCYSIILTQDIKKSSWWRTTSTSTSPCTTCATSTPPTQLAAPPAQPGLVPQLNWSCFKPEFVGRPDEDAEAHLLGTNDWMDTHAFLEGVKVQRFC